MCKEKEFQDDGMYSTEDIYRETYNFWGTECPLDEEESMRVNRLHRGTKE